MIPAPWQAPRRQRSPQPASGWLEIRQYTQKRIHDDSSIRNRSDDTGGFFAILLNFHLRQRGEIAHAIDEQFADEVVNSCWMQPRTTGGSNPVSHHDHPRDSHRDGASPGAQAIDTQTTLPPFSLLGP